MYELMYAFDKIVIEGSTHSDYIHIHQLSLLISRAICILFSILSALSVPSSNACWPGPAVMSAVHMEGAISAVVACAAR